MVQHFHFTRRKLEIKQTQIVYETTDADRKASEPRDFLNRRKLEEGQIPHFQDTSAGAERMTVTGDRFIRIKTD